MYNEKKSEEYENKGNEYLKKVLPMIMNRYGKKTVVSCERTKKYTHNDSVVTFSDNSTITVENKVREYKYEQFPDLFFRMEKTEGKDKADLYSMIYPKSNVICFTNDEQIKDLTPSMKFVNHTETCDKDSLSGYQMNYSIPKDRLWVYSMTDGKLLSKPKQK